MSTLIADSQSDAKPVGAPSVGSTTQDASTSSAPLPISSEDSHNLELWTRFLIAYANGDATATPQQPPLPRYLQERLDHVVASNQPWPFADAPLYPSTTITTEIARTIREYYCSHGYLPPPRAPLEEERNQCIRDYDLYSVKQLANIQSATDLIAAVFPDTVTTFSLFQDRIQTHFALSGPPELIKTYQLTVGLRIPSEDSLCGHAILLDQNILFVPDLENDWRMRLNPFRLAGFKSFIGSSVSLELDPQSKEPRNPSEQDASAHTETSGAVPKPRRVSIGTLNICFVENHHPVLTEAERVIISRVTKMLEVQLRGSWEGDQRRRDGRARVALSEFIEESLVENAGLAQEPSVASSTADLMGDGRGTMRVLAESAVEKISKIVIEAGSISIWDVRAFTRSTGLAQYVDPANFPMLKIASKSMSDPVPGSLLPPAVATLLSATDHIFTSGHPSGLESVLPASTTSHLVLSFSDANEPVFLFVITTSLAHYHFTSSDVNFIRNIGSILLARSVQARVLKADAAKTSFLSAISHELRTPMHAVVQSHALMRQALDSQEYNDLGAVLSLSESSSRTLTNILNDVLDYGKGSAGDHAKDHQSLVSDLANLTVQIVKMTQTQYLDQSVPVELFVEWEDREWDVRIDEARFQRVLMNGLTNAMKFCRKGSITVRLTSRADNLVVEVIDTGIGFDEALMPQVLQAFTKLDKYSAGAGLGLHITKTMLERAGGSLRLRSRIGEGTTFEAILPVSFAGPATSNMTSSYIRKNVADGSVRMSSQGAPLLSPGSNHTTDGDEPATPPPVSDLKATSVHTNRPSSIERAPPDGAPLRVLIADDNFVCRRLLSKTLRRGRPNLQVQEAEDGAQALKVFEEWSPNLVLTDVCMPNMGGIESAEKMRESENSNMGGSDSPKSQIYALTALGKTDQRSISLAMNGHASLDGWLVKGEDMTEVVSSILDRMTIQQESTPATTEHGQKSALAKSLDSA